MFPVKKVKANERQIGGTHYQYKSKSGQEHWDVVYDFDLDYFQGQITKYVMRWKNKGGVQDLEKAMHYLEKYMNFKTLRHWCGGLLVRIGRLEYRCNTCDRISYRGR